MLFDYGLPKRLELDTVGDTLPKIGPFKVLGRDNVPPIIP